VSEKIGQGGRTSHGRGPTTQGKSQMSGLGVRGREVEEGGVS
jgi:hypothetical protein